MASNNYNSDYKYAEIIKTLEDYKYGDSVKCSILSLTPFLNQNDPIRVSTYNSGSNVLNKVTTNLKYGFYTSCNYINIIIPERLYERTYNNEEDLQGYKGDKFIYLPVGGNINDYIVVGRYNK